MVEFGKSWADYLEIKRMNPSTLVAGCRSMKRLKRCIDGGFPEETDPMRFGTGLHALLLEPAEFESRFCVVPDFHLDADNLRKPKSKSESIEDRRTESKVTDYYKSKIKEFAATNGGRQFLTRQQYDDCLFCIESLRSRPKIAQTIDQSRKEVTLTGEILGVPFKGRVDLLRIDKQRGLITDLKTTSDIEKHAFGRVFMRLRYDFKMCLYRELVKQETGKEYKCAMICQEVGGDFDNAFVPIPDIVLDNAMTRVVSVIADYKKAMADNQWHGVDRGKEKYELAIPDWAMEDDEEVDWSALPAEELEPVESPF